MGVDQVVYARPALMLQEVAVLAVPGTRRRDRCQPVDQHYPGAHLAAGHHDLLPVPRLLATGAALFVLMPWMWRHLGQFTVQIFSELPRYLR